MNDMRHVIVPKSDQLNSDDLIAGPITIKVREVTIRGGQEQPVSIHFTDDGGKPYKPCKSMSRVLVSAWGRDANKYVGRSLTLYRDPTVKWAGMEVGGIRISHLSHIERDMVMALTATKGSRKPFMVKPLKAGAAAETANGASDERSAGVEQQPIVTPYHVISWDDERRDFEKASDYLAGLKTAFDEAPDRDDWWTRNVELFNELHSKVVQSGKNKPLIAAFDETAKYINGNLAGRAA